MYVLPRIRVSHARHVCTPCWETFAPLSQVIRRHESGNGRRETELAGRRPQPLHRNLRRRTAWLRRPSNNRRLLRTAQNGQWMSCLSDSMWEWVGGAINGCDLCVVILACLNNYGGFDGKCNWTRPVGVAGGGHLGALPRQFVVPRKILSTLYETCNRNKNRCPWNCILPPTVTTWLPDRIKLICLEYYSFVGKDA